MVTLWISALVGCWTPPPPPAAPASVAGSSRYPDCTGSCSLGDRPQTTAAFSEEAFLDALETWAAEPLGEPTLALETLLFHGAETVGWLSVHADTLSADQQAFLRHELSRDQVEIEMRLIDDDGVERGVLRSGIFSLREKQHLVFEGTDTLMRLETGGKVKRVGLAHLWSRW